MKNQFFYVSRYKSRNNMKNFKQKSKGFTLIELILVLGISSLAFIGLVQFERKKAEIANGEIAGEQIREVGEALESYINRNAAALTANIPVNTTSANLPLTILQNTAFGAFPGTAILPATYVNRNLIGGAYQIRIRNDNNNLIGLVTTTNPIATSGVVRYDLAGAAMKKAGPKSAVAFLVNNQISGYDGAWTLAAAQYPSITTAGQLAYRSQAINSPTYDNVYLRLDGAFPMRGNLNMGNFNINNVTDINVNGFVNTNAILTNTINSGTINNAGNITNAGNIVNTGLIDSTGQIISRNSTETNFINRNNTLGSRDLTVGDGTAAIANQGNIRARDIFIRGGSSVTGRPAVNGGNGAWLSDLLPRYSSRGILLVSNGSVFAKPSCAIGGTANAKVEIIPQLHYIQGRVLGSYNPATTQLYSVGALVAYANDLGASWQIILTTPVYDGAYVGGTALAHVYCDNGF